MVNALKKLAIVLPMCQAVCELPAVGGETDMVSAWSHRLAIIKNSDE